MHVLMKFSTRVWPTNNLSSKASTSSFFCRPVRHELNEPHGFGNSSPAIGWLLSNASYSFGFGKVAELGFASDVRSNVLLVEEETPGRCLPREVATCRSWPIDGL